MFNYVIMLFISDFLVEVWIFMLYTVKYSICSIQPGHARRYELLYWVNQGVL